MKIVFMGTPDFAVPTLKELIEAGHEVGYVVTQPDRARNRGKVTFSPVKEAALAAGIEVLQPEKLSLDCEEKAKILAFQPDAIIVVAYGQILKKDLLELPVYGCFNVHGSLLPKLRGAAPMQRAIYDGLEKTGVTIMKMGEGLDDGDMVAKQELLIERKNFEQVHDALSEMGARLLVDTLPKIADGSACYSKQDEAEATYAKRLVKQDGKIDFRRTPEEIDQQIRAFDPWPGAFCTYQGANMKLWGAEPMGKECNLAPGTVVRADKGGLEVSCGGRTLRITELQVPGKKRTMTSDFLRGHAIAPGTVLE